MGNFVNFVRVKNLGEFKKIELVRIGSLSMYFSNLERVTALLHNRGSLA